MARPWDKARELAIRIARRVRRFDRSDLDPRSVQADPRFRRLQAHLDVLHREIRELQRRIRTGAPGAAQTDEVSSLLVRARDFRFKIRLLEEERDQAFPEARQAAPAPCRASDQEVPAELRDAVVRMSATARFDSQRQAAQLARAAEDLLGVDRVQRHRALRELARLEVPEIVRVLERALAIQDDELREVGLEVLTRLRIGCLGGRIGPLLESPNPRIRLLVLQALRSTGDPGATAACLAGLADSNSDVRRRAASLAGPDAAGALVVALQDEDAQVRIAAARTLGATGSERGVFMLIRTLRDEDAKVRLAARDAIGCILGFPLAVRLDRDPRTLADQCDQLLRWWTTARVEGPPWKSPRLRAAVRSPQGSSDSSSPREEPAHHEIGQGA